MFIHRTKRPLPPVVPLQSQTLLRAKFHSIWNVSMHDRASDPRIRSFSEESSSRMHSYLPKSKESAFESVPEKCAFRHYLVGQRRTLFFYEFPAKAILGMVQLTTYSLDWLPCVREIYTNPTIKRGFLILRCPVW